MTSAELPEPFTIGGLHIPAIGLGTFQSSDGNGNVKDAVLNALRLGYRHIDTASAYGNEKEVGEAIRESGVPREEIFLTTKLNQQWHTPNDVAEACKRSLDALQLGYVDLYLMHFPYAYLTDLDHGTRRHQNGKPMMDFELSRAYTTTWAAMEKLVDQGKAKAIGLSNFNILKTKRVLESARIRPLVVQVELHPYLPQPRLLNFCKEQGIHVTAHQPFGGRPIAALNLNAEKPRPIEHETIKQIAQEYDKTAAQVLLSWAVQRGTSAIPKTVTDERLVENIATFELQEEHFDMMNRLTNDKGTIRFLDPREYVGFDIFNEAVDEPVSM